MGCAQTQCALLPAFVWLISGLYCPSSSAVAQHFPNGAVPSVVTEHGVWRRGARQGQERTGMHKNWPSSWKRCANNLRQWMFSMVSSLGELRGGIGRA